VLVRRWKGSLADLYVTDRFAWRRTGLLFLVIDPMEDGVTVDRNIADTEGVCECSSAERVAQTFKEDRHFVVAGLSLFMPSRSPLWME
jgi:hypothetical protein